MRHAGDVPPDSHHLSTPVVCLYRPTSTPQIASLRHKICVIRPTGFTQGDSIRGQIPIKFQNLVFQFRQVPSGRATWYLAPTWCNGCICRSSPGKSGSPCSTGRGRFRVFCAVTGFEFCRQPSRLPLDKSAASLTKTGARSY